MLDEAKKIHRPTRLQGYDYSSPGYYFVTFNTKVRAENILCSIENVGPAPLGGPAKEVKTIDNDPPKGAGPTSKPCTTAVGPAPLGGPVPKGKPVVKLTQAGEILRDLIENIHCVYLNADVDSYVIMPDHVHLLLYFAQANDGPPRKGKTFQHDPPRGAGPTCRPCTSAVGPAPLGGPATQRSIQEGRPFQHGPAKGPGPTGLEAREVGPTGLETGFTKRRAFLPQVINALKSLASKKAGFSLWQEGYHDHIIRNDADLRSIREYIQNNPLRWILDKD